MSDYGIQVTREAGKVQIDGTHKNFSIYTWDEETKVVGAYAFTPWVKEEIAQVFSLVDRPIICVSLGDTNASGTTKFIGTPTQIGWNGTYHTNFRHDCGGAAMQIQWMALAPAHYKPRQHYGLEIYNADADKVFSSWEPYAEVIDTYDFTLAAGATSAFNWTNIDVVDANNHMFFLATRNYNWYYNWAIHPANKLQYYTMGMARVDNDTVQIGSGVYIGERTFSGSPSYVEGNMWTNNGVLIELAHVRNLM